MTRVLVVAALAACTQHVPAIRVLGVHRAVFVEVTNPASRPLRLTRLAFALAEDGATVAHGEVRVARDVPARAAIIVDVPIEESAARATALHGVLTVRVGDAEHTFAVAARMPTR